MDSKTAAAIKVGFLAWSGGIPPESDAQIFIYVEAARPAESDEYEVSQLLKAWMREADPG